jgi:hypothetical protein
MRGKLIIVVLLAAMTGLAEARQGRGGRRGGPFGGFGGPRENPAAAMEIQEGKVFLINGSTLYKVDAREMKVEASVSLAELAKAEAEKEAEAKEKTKKDTVPLPQYLQRFDKNNDGKIEKEEAGGENDRTWRWIGRIDRDGDNVITGKEARESERRMTRQFTGSRKPAVIKIVEKSVLVLTKDRMFKFERETLKFEGSVAVPDDDLAKARAERRKRDAEAAKQRAKERKEKDSVKPPKAPEGDGF